MRVSRVATRSLRAARTYTRGTSRRYSTGQQPQNVGSTSQAAIGGLIGGSAVFLFGYGYYYFSGAKTAVNSFQKSKEYIDQATKKLSEKTPEPNEAIKWLRETSLGYAAFIPGGKQYVNSAFDDLDTIRAKHGGEVDKIVRDTYNEIKMISQRKGASVETAQEVWTVLEQKLKEIGKLVGDTAEDILENHPEIKRKVGGNLDQLQALSDKYGSEAKAELEKTWNQIGDIISKGISADSASQIQKVVQEKIEVVKKLGDKAFQKGMDQVKPYLEKSPKAKELVQENVDALKQGDMEELWEKVKEAANTGNTDSLEDFVKSSIDKAKSKGSGINIESYLKQIPGADQIVPKLTQLQEIGQKHGEEAEEILKSTVKEIQQVLSTKVEQAEKLAKNAKEDSD